MRFGETEITGFSFVFLFFFFVFAGRRLGYWGGGVGGIYLKDS